MSLETSLYQSDMSLEISIHFVFLRGGSSFLGVTVDVELVLLRLVDCLFNDGFTVEDEDDDEAEGEFLWSPLPFSSSFLFTGIYLKYNASKCYVYSIINFHT